LIENTICNITHIKIIYILSKKYNDDLIILTY